MYCQNCGFKLEVPSAFCPNCGVPTGQVPPTAPGAAGTASQPHGVAGALIDGVTSKVNQMAGGQGAVPLRFKDFFTGVFQRHTRDEAEKIFICGTAETTPDPASISSEWPHPWLYSRVILVFSAALFALAAAWSIFGAMVSIPAIIVIGSFMVPIATMVFFFEVNAPRNISFLTIMQIFLLGGAAAILLVFPLYELFPGAGAESLFPALLTSLVEEVGKLVIVAFFIKTQRGRRYILNGLLIGAAVGAGFASIESAGYAFSSFLEVALASGSAELGVISAYDTIILRGILAISGHVAWAAISGAALQIALAGGPFDWGKLFDARFLGLFAIPVALHAIWDWFPIYPVLLVLTVVVWVVLVVLLHRGIDEVNQVSGAQAARTAR